MLPTKEKVFIDQKGECSFLIDYENQVGRINILDNISAMLRFFIKVFFANPYVVNSVVKIEPSCSQKIPKGTNWIGIKSDYLINNK